MKLKTGDLVFLKNNYPYQSSASTPVFGSGYGYVYGRVVKLSTNSHDPNEHRCIVQWSNGHKWSLKEEYLQRIAPDNPVMVPPTEGLYILMKPEKNFSGYRVGMIGPEEVSSSKNAGWYSIYTRVSMPETVTEDSLLQALPAAKAEKKEHLCSLTAAAHVLRANGFTPAIQPDDLVRVPLFRNFTEAINSHPSPSERSFLLFTLPSIEVSDELHATEEKT